MTRLEFALRQRKDYLEILIPIIEVELPPWVCIGKNVTIRSGTKIGTQGFGYEWDGNEYLQIPHVGRVIIEDNVIIHENSNISRGTIGDTVIGKGTRIDSNVHVAHNVKIGKNCLIVAGATLGGSCIIGDRSWIGPNSWIEEHAVIGENSLIGAGAVVTKNIPPGQVWAGIPARYIRDRRDDE